MRNIIKKKQLPLFLLGGALLSAAIVNAQGVMPPAQLGPGGDAAYQRGIEVWRSPGKDNTPCVFCHAPDALEIAAYNFSDGDIKRRAIPHLGEKGADEIVDFIHAVRHRYGITKLLDSMKDRPLQPGDEILPGSTPEERDLAFARELEDKTPLMAKGEVNSLADAKKVKDELLAVDPWNLPVGIVFNRISEDGFHGKQHATFAHWISDTALALKFPWSTYLIHQDDYLRNPTNRNLFSIVFSPDRNPEEVYNYQYQSQMSYNKYRSLLIFQHVARRRFMGKTGYGEDGPVYFGSEKPRKLPNPLLDLGVFADARVNTPFTEFSFPTKVLDKKLVGPSEAEQMEQIRLPALYAGWLMDQGLQRSGLNLEDRSTRILLERLFSDGPYAMHAAFVVSRKLLVDGFVPMAWGRTEPQHFYVDYSAFLGDDNVSKFEPSDPAEKAIYQRFVVNSFMMSLYLLADQGTANLKLEEKTELAKELPQMRAYIAKAAAQRLTAFDAVGKQISTETTKP